MRILGIDPGTVTMGYGLVESEESELAMVGCGALTASPKTPLPSRLHSLYLALLEIIDRYQPSAVAIERPFVARNVRSAFVVGEASAVAILAATTKGLPIYQYAPAQVKQSVTDYGRSDKGQIQEMVRIQLGLSSPPQPTDAADALAVAICHIRQAHLASLVTDSIGGET